MARKRYTVIFEHGDRPNQWLASVKELPECHTFGRGLEQTRERIREALALWEGAGAEAAELIEELPLPPTLKRRIGAWRTLRDRLQVLELERQEQLAGVVAEMLGNWSTRDIATVLGISHQRVNQVGPANKSARLAGIGKSRTAEGTTGRGAPQVTVQRASRRSPPRGGRGARG